MWNRLQAGVSIPVQQWNSPLGSQVCYTDVFRGIS